MSTPSLQDSALWKIARLVDNDDAFAARVRAAAALERVEFTSELLLAVASDTAVLAEVVVGDLNVVSSDGVPDAVIITAVKTMTGA